MTGTVFASVMRFLDERRGPSPEEIITTLTSQWQDEYRAFAERDLSEARYEYLWVDGIPVNIRLGEHRLCLLVILGARRDGQRELVALADVSTDGCRESTAPWADLLRDCQRRGLRAPALAVGDGALGFWDAYRDVFGTIKELHCWLYTNRRVLALLPALVQSAAQKALAKISKADDKEKALAAVEDFATAYGKRFPQAVCTITAHRDQVLGLYDFPARYRQHLRTTSPIESIFGTVRHERPPSQAITGPGSRDVALAMACKLARSALARWAATNSPDPT